MCDVTIAGYHLGCPMWAEPSWRGSFAPRVGPANEALTHYASVFNTVEGNTTFYSLPSAESVARWADVTPPDFRFCFKAPRSVTHDARLVEADDTMDTLLERIAPLGERLGPLMVQLPPSFGPDRLGALDAFLDRFARGCEVAVELRHRGFFDDPAAAEDADAVLNAHACERIVMDTRALRAGDPRHPQVVAARHAKPDLPVRPGPLTDRPLYRWVGHPDATTNEPWLRDLASLVGAWMRDGRCPYVMIHCPDTGRTPWMARRFHEILATTHPDLDVGELPPFPAERAAASDAQLSLF